MKVTKETISGEVIHGEYIPLKMTAETSCSDAMYYTVRKGDQSLLELTSDRNDAKVKRISLFLCQNFRRQMEYFSLPDRCESGDVLAECVENVDSEPFVYNDAVQIPVSHDIPDQWLRSEKYFGISE